MIALECTCGNKIGSPQFSSHQRTGFSARPLGGVANSSRRSPKARKPRASIRSASPWSYVNPVPLSLVSRLFHAVSCGSRGFMHSLSRFLF
jgi:hypothetical protein